VLFRSDYLYYNAAIDYDAFVYFAGKD
jgi:hypothetical protein